MGKFNDCLTQTGGELIKKRADNLTIETKELFEDSLRSIEKSIRRINNEIISMEDLSVRSTQELVVGEHLNTSAWVNKRINLALEKRDLEIEKEIVKNLIKEYFD